MQYASNHPGLVLPVSFEAEVTARVLAGDRRNFLYIVPTAAEARDLINRITALCRDRALMLPHILSLGEFITALRTVVRPQLQLISAGQSAALIELSIRELFARGALHYFEERSSAGPGLPLFQGTFDEIVAAINGLKEQGVSVERLGELLERAPQENSERRKLQDIHAIYSAYTDRIRDSLVDLYGQYFILIDRLALPIRSGEDAKAREYAAFFRMAFPNVRDVLIAPFVRFTEPALDLLLPLGSVDELNVTFALDRENVNPELFRFQNTLADILEERGFVIQARAHGPTEGVEQFRSHLRLSLFSRRANAEPFDAKTMIAEHRAISIEAEVRFVARQVKLLLSAEMAPEMKQIAIASTDQALYAPLVRSVFAEYGIPVQLTHRSMLAQLPIYHAFEYLLSLALFGLSRRRVRSVVESPYFTIHDAHGEPIDRHSLLAVMTRHHLPQGAAEWSSEIEELIADVEYRLTMIFEDEFERRTLEDDLSELRRSLPPVRRLEAFIVAGRRQRTPSEFVRFVRETLHELDLAGSVVRTADLMLGAGVLEEQTRALAALESLLDELESLCATLGLANTPLELGFYLERLRTASTRARSAERAEPGSAVIVTSFDQLYGNEYDHVFLMGLREGLFPRAYRRALFAPKEHSKTHDVHLVEQRFEYYQTLATFRTHLTLSWHTGTEEGTRAYNRSLALDALRRIVLCDEVVDTNTTVLSRPEFYRLAATAVASGSPEQLDVLLAVATDAGLDQSTARTLRTSERAVVGAEQMRRHDAANVFSGVLPKSDFDKEERDRLDIYRDHVYSITQLETYAACGFKYFCRYVLGLSKTQTEIEDGLDSLEKGTIVHTSLFRLLERLRERGLNIRTMGAAALVSAREVIDELYPETSLERMHPFARLDHGQLLGSGVEGANVIERFIQAEQDSKLQSITTQPRYFELAFGQRGAAERTEYPDPHPPVEVGGIKLRGKIDRIDMDDDGNFVVIDYKTGSMASRADMERGTSLQLPLYVRIAEDLLRAHLGDEAVRGVAALYHSLKETDKPRQFRIALEEAIDSGAIEPTNIRKKFASVEELEGFIDTVIGFAQQYVEGIVEGRFQLVRADRKAATCSRCEFQAVCRVAQAEADGVLPVG